MMEYQVCASNSSSFPCLIFCQTSLQQGIYDQQQGIYDQQQGIYDQQQGMYAEQQDINNKVGVIMVNLIPSPFTPPSNSRTGICGSRPSRSPTTHCERRAPLWGQTRMSEGNKERGPQRYWTLARKRRDPTCLLAQRSGWDRKIDHRPIVRRDDLRERRAWSQLLLFTRLRGPQQSTKDLPNPRLPTRLPISAFPTTVAGGFEGAPKCWT